MDIYSNFAELAACEDEGIDYEILWRQTDSPIAILAPHGGNIEPGTLEIADALAGTDFTFYAFKAKKEAENRKLHIGSDRYDEPRALRTLANTVVAIAIHGCHHQEQRVFIGGRNHPLKEAILQALQAAGFTAAISDIPGLRGIGPNNLCNRCGSGQGVQLEISRGLRNRLLQSSPNGDHTTRNADFCSFVGAVRRALRSFR